MLLDILLEVFLSLSYNTVIVSQLLFKMIIFLFTIILILNCHFT